MIQMLQSASASRPLGYGVLTIAFVRRRHSRPLLELTTLLLRHLTFVMLVLETRMTGILRGGALSAPCAQQPRFQGLYGV
jgi:hypothetical protein